MNILLSTDNNYVMPTGVLMTSIGMNCGQDVNFYILVNEKFSIENRNALASVANRFDNAISFIVVANELLNNLPFGRENQPHKISIETYYRLFVTELIPGHVHKILYLDGDMIVRKSLTDLWNVSLEGHSIAVCHDCDELSHCESKRLPYPMENGYFNAGVMLINVDYWREHKCLDAFLLFAKEHYEDIVYHDQDILNSVFNNSLIWLPMTYNFITVNIRHPYVPMTDEYKSEVDRCKYDPCIIHFASVDKPWKIDSYNPYTTVWRYYWRKTKWDKDGLVNETRTTIKDKIKTILYRKGLFVPVRGYDSFKLYK